MKNEKCYNDHFLRDNIHILNCKKCKAKTKQSIYHQSRSKGVKLFCLVCCTKWKRYHNLQNLKGGQKIKWQ